MRRRTDVSPLWKDVKRGTPGGSSGGNYVLNDGEGPSTSYTDRLMDEDYAPLMTKSGETLFA